MSEELKLALSRDEARWHIWHALVVASKNGELRLPTDLEARARHLLAVLLGEIDP